MNPMEELIDLYDRIKVAQKILKNLQDRYNILQERVLKSGREVVGDHNHKVYVKEIREAYIPERFKKDIIDYIEKVAPDSIRKNVHPYTLHKLLDMGLIEEYRDKIETESKKVIRIEFVDTAAEITAFEKAEGLSWVDFAHPKEP